MRRVRIADLEFAIDWLNQKSKGVYGITKDWGKFQLVRFLNGKDWIKVIGYPSTKKELWHTLNTILTYLAEEEEIR